MDDIKYFYQDDSGDILLATMDPTPEVSFYEDIGDPLGKW